jgi:hypothetical protein
MSIWKIFKRKLPISMSILKKYRKMKKTSSGFHHERQYLYVQWLCQQNQDALYELVFSGKCTEVELCELIWLGRTHTGSCAKKDNLSWVPFISRVMLRKDELPYYVRSNLEWYQRVHGW